MAIEQDIRSMVTFVRELGPPGATRLILWIVNGWDTGVLEAAIKDCDDDKAQGDLMQCRPFALLDPEITSDCVTDARIDEQVDGWMPKLPGCNPPSPTCTDTATIGPPKRYDVDVSAKKWKYVGCALYVPKSPRPIDTDIYDWAT